MAQTPESKVKSKVKAVLDYHGAYYFFPASNGYGHAGIPDIIVCHYGFFFAIECKAGKKQPTALQERELKRIREHGGVALVINESNIDDIEQYLNYAKEEHDRTTNAINSRTTNTSLM
jgi:Archaeal holliday junction resolvase (hjc)